MRTRTVFSILLVVVTASACAGGIRDELGARIDIPDYQSSTRDAWIDGRIEAMLHFDPRLGRFDLYSEVDNGTVTLSGAVESQTDLALAEQVSAGVPGVNAVDNRISVGAAPYDKPQRDAWIHGNVDSVLANNRNLRGVRIETAVENGVVLLEGTVDSAVQAKVAVDLAARIKDVRRVENRLVVKN